MKFYLDIDSYALLRAPYDRQASGLVEVKRGDQSLFEVYFVRNGQLLSGQAPATLQFGCKEPGKYDAPAIVYQETWLPSQPATAAAEVAAGAVTRILWFDAGRDYETPPLITINGDGSGATALAEIFGGSLSRIILTAPGTGYTAPPSITIEPPPLKFTAAISFDTAPLNSLFAIDQNAANDAPFIDLMAEFTWGFARK